MRKLVAMAALVAALTGTVLAGTASAASTNTGTSGNNYSTKTGIFGLIQCASYYTEIGDHVPGYLYLNVSASRTQGTFCAGGPYTGNYAQAASMYVIVEGYGIAGWFTCYTSPTFWNATNSHSAVSGHHVFAGCGDLDYRAYGYPQVKMDPGNGVFSWWASGHYTYPVHLNG